MWDGAITKSGPKSTETYIAQRQENLPAIFSSALVKGGLLFWRIHMWAFFFFFWVCGNSIGKEADVMSLVYLVTDNHDFLQEQRRWDKKEWHYSAANNMSSLQFSSGSRLCSVHIMDALTAHSMK